MSAVLDRRALAVEDVADHAQRPPGLVSGLGIGETRQALDGLEVSLVRSGHRLGRDGDVELRIGVLGVAQPLHAGAEGGAGGHRLLRHRRTVSHGEAPTRRNSAQCVIGVEGGGAASRRVTAAAGWAGIFPLAALWVLGAEW
jgi:hypothetical protein